MDDLPEITLSWRRLVSWTSTPVRTLEELLEAETLVTRVHHCRVRVLSSSWDLAKVVSSMARCAVILLAEPSAASSITIAKLPATSRSNKCLTGETPAKAESGTTPVHTSLSTSMRVHIVTSLVYCALAHCPMTSCRELLLCLKESRMTALRDCVCQRLLPELQDGAKITQHQNNRTNHTPASPATTTIANTIDSPRKSASWNAPQSQHSHRRCNFATSEPVRVILSLLNLWHRTRSHMCLMADAANKASHSIAFIDYCTCSSAILCCYAHLIPWASDLPTKDIAEQTSKDSTEPTHTIVQVEQDTLSELFATYWLSHVLEYGLLGGVHQSWQMMYYVHNVLQANQPGTHLASSPVRSSNNTVQSEVKENDHTHRSGVCSKCDKRSLYFIHKDAPGLLGIGLSDAGVQMQWARLRERCIREAYRELRTETSTLRRRWQREVQPILSLWARTHSPQILIENFSRPPMMSKPTCSSNTPCTAHDVVTEDKNALDEDAKMHSFFDWPSCEAKDECASVNSVHACLDRLRVMASPMQLPSSSILCSTPHVETEKQHVLTTPCPTDEDGLAAMLFIERADRLLASSCFTAHSKRKAVRTRLSSDKHCNNERHAHSRAPCCQCFTLSWDVFQPYVLPAVYAAVYRGNWHAAVCLLEWRRLPSTTEVTAQSSYSYTQTQGVSDTTGHYTAWLMRLKERCRMSDMRTPSLSQNSFNQRIRDDDSSVTRDDDRVFLNENSITSSSSTYSSGLHDNAYDCTNASADAPTALIDISTCRSSNECDDYHSRRDQSHMAWLPSAHLRQCVCAPLYAHMVDDMYAQYDVEQALHVLVLPQTQCWCRLRFICDAVLRRPPRVSDVPRSTQPPEPRMMTFINNTIHTEQNVICGNSTRSNSVGDEKFDGNNTSMGSIDHIADSDANKCKAGSHSNNHANTRDGKSESSTACWGWRVLSDGLAIPFLLAALATVANYALDVGDVPLARVYHTALAHCLCYTPHPPSLTRYLQLLARLAGVFAQKRGSIGCTTSAAQRVYQAAIWRACAAYSQKQRCNVCSSVRKKVSHESASDATQNDHITNHACASAECVVAVCDVRAKRRQRLVHGEAFYARRAFFASYAALACRALGSSLPGCTRNDAIAMHTNGVCVCRWGDKYRNDSMTRSPWLEGMDCLVTPRAPRMSAFSTIHTNDHSNDTENYSYNEASDMHSATMDDSRHDGRTIQTDSNFDRDAGANTANDEGNTVGSAIVVLAACQTLRRHAGELDDAGDDDILQLERWEHGEACLRRLASKLPAHRGTHFPTADEVADERQGCRTRCVANRRMRMVATKLWSVPIMSQTQMHDAQTCLREIVHENRHLLRSPTASFSACSTSAPASSAASQAQTLAWWAQRVGLDIRVHRVVAQLQGELGIWRAGLAGSVGVLSLRQYVHDMARFLLDEVHVVLKAQRRRSVSASEKQIGNLTNQTGHAASEIRIDVAATRQWRSGTVWQQCVSILSALPFLAREQTPTERASQDDGRTHDVTEQKTRPFHCSSSSQSTTSSESRGSSGAEETVYDTSLQAKRSVPEWSERVARERVAARRRTGVVCSPYCVQEGCVPCADYRTRASQVVREFIDHQLSLLPMHTLAATPLKKLTRDRPAAGMTAPSTAHQKDRCSGLHTRSLSHTLFLRPVSQEALERLSRGVSESVLRAFYHEAARVTRHKREAETHEAGYCCCHPCSSSSIRNMNDSNKGNASNNVAHHMIDSGSHNLGKEETNSDKSSGHSMSKTYFTDGAVHTPMHDVCRTSTEEHVDLLCVPRSHVYLVLDNTLHDVPWEAMDVLCRTSVSRIPAVDYVACMHRMYENGFGKTSQGKPRAIFEKTLLRIDLAATSHAEHFAQLAKSHAGRWCVEYDNAVAYTPQKSKSATCSVTKSNDNNNNNNSNSVTSDTRTAATNSVDKGNKSMHHDSNHADVSLHVCNQKHQTKTADTDDDDEDSMLLRRMMHGDFGALVYIGHRRGEQALSRAQLYDRMPTDIWHALLKCCSDHSRTDTEVAASAVSGTTTAATESSGEGTRTAVCSGETLLHRENIMHVLSRQRVALIMGCSSARMQGNAFCEVFGMPYAYLHAGFAAFIGCLWDVTDREVDRLTYHVLLSQCGRATGCARSSLPLGQMLAQARTACKLPYLSAFATVMYGVDV